MGALLVLVGQHSAFTAYYVYRDNTLLETVSNFRRKYKHLKKLVATTNLFPVLVILCSLVIYVPRYRYHYCKKCSNCCRLC